MKKGMLYLLPLVIAFQVAASAHTRLVDKHSAILLAEIAPTPRVKPLVLPVIEKRPVAAGRNLSRRTMKNRGVPRAGRNARRFRKPTAMRSMRK